MRLSEFGCSNRGLCEAPTRWRLFREVVGWLLVVFGGKNRMAPAFLSGGRDKMEQGRKMDGRTMEHAWEKMMRQMTDTETLRHARMSPTWQCTCSVMCPPSCMVCDSVTGLPLAVLVPLQRYYC